MSVTNVVASAARTTSSQSAAFYPVADFDVAVNVTAASGTTPTLDITVEWSNDGAIWFKGDPADAFTQLTIVSARVRRFVGKAQVARLAWVIAGTTPSFTFTADVHSVGNPY